MFRHFTRYSAVLFPAGYIHLHVYKTIGNELNPDLFTECLTRNKIQAVQIERFLF
jgi:hypothetical protein